MPLNSCLGKNEERGHGGLGGGVVLPEGSGRRPGRSSLGSVVATAPFPVYGYMMEKIFPYPDKREVSPSAPCSKQEWAERWAGVSYQARTCLPTLEPTLNR